MTTHSNEIAFIISDDGQVVITEAGDVITPYELAGMYMDAKRHHAVVQGFSGRHIDIFDNCPSCRKWVVAERMYRAIAK